MTCKTYQERITREIDRLTVEDESSDLRKHIRLCADCQTYFDEEVRMLDVSRVALAPFRLRELISPEVMNRLPETDGLEYLPTSRSRAIRWAIGLSAAAVILIVGIFSYSPAQKLVLPEISEKVAGAGGTTPTSTLQDSSKYTEQSIVIADIVAVDEHNTLKLNIASTICGNNLSVAVQVGESMQSQSVWREMPDGTFAWVTQVVPVPIYEYQTQFLEGATVSLATANDRTVKLKGLKSGDKVIVMFPAIPAAKLVNGEVILNPESVSRSLPWSEDMENEIREDVARQDERKHGKPDLSTPEMAWAAFVEALKSGDEERIKAVTTEKGYSSLKAFLSADNLKRLQKELSSWSISRWEKDDDKTATISGPAGGSPLFRFTKTVDNWKLDVVMESAPAWREEFVSIAVVGGADLETQTHVQSLLKKNGIKSYIEGSAVYGIFVMKQEEERATNILKQDVAGEKYWIKFAKEIKPTSDSNDQPKFLNRTQQKALVELNNWDKEELDVAERPGAYPGRKPSGETGGWIVAHKKELQKLGVEVEWNADRRQYMVTKITKFRQDLSTPERAWTAFTDALKSGDEERIKAVTTEKGRESLNGWKGKASEYAAEQWSNDGETARATAWREPKVPGGFVTIELKKTPEGWKLDNMARGE